MKLASIMLRLMCALALAGVTWSAATVTSGNVSTFVPPK